MYRVRLDSPSVYRTSSLEPDQRHPDYRRGEPRRHTEERSDNTCEALRTASELGGPSILLLHHLTGS
jgi:hypothetical protein